MTPRSQMQKRLASANCHLCEYGKELIFHLLKCKCTSKEKENHRLSIKRKLFLGHKMFRSSQAARRNALLRRAKVINPFLGWVWTRVRELRHKLLSRNESSASVRQWKSDGCCVEQITPHRRAHTYIRKYASDWRVREKLEEKADRHNFSCHPLHCCCSVEQ
jgi:hypothetical protein